MDGGITLPGLTDMTVEPDEIAYGMCTKRQVTMQEMEAW